MSPIHENPSPEQKPRVEAIKEAIVLAQKEPRPVSGTLVAHPTDEESGELLRYEDDMAVISFSYGREGRFPKNEIFDVALVLKMAESIRVVGFYRPDHIIAVVE